MLFGLLAATCFTAGVLPGFSANDSAKNTVMGIPQNEFVQAQGALAEAFATKDIAALNAEIAKLMDQRDELMFAAAAKLHPELAAQIKTIADAAREQKKLRNPAPGS